LDALGEIEFLFIQITDFDFGLRLDLTGSALPGILPSASSRAHFRGFLVRISLRPVQLPASAFSFAHRIGLAFLCSAAI
jgi:hypothetical protein